MVKVKAGSHYSSSKQFSCSNDSTYYLTLTFSNLLMMKLSTTSFVIILQAVSLTKATAETNLRGASDLNADITPDDTLDIMRELEDRSINTTDEEVICHPYDLQWDDLTSEQRVAARDLSFNSRKWDDDTLLDPSAIRHDYWIDAPSGETELTNTERTAAILLGYTEGKRPDIVLSGFLC